MFENSFSFEGRIRRLEYGLSFIIYMIGAVITNSLSIGSDYMGFLYIPLLWFLWAQGCKRCHDLGNSGWYQIIPFYILWLFFQEGQVFANGHGANPKGLYVAPPAEKTDPAKKIILAYNPQPVIIPENHKTTIDVQNVNYSLTQDLLRQLRAMDITRSLTYDFMGNTATISILHKNTTQNLLDKLYPVLENIDVLSLNDSAISLKIK